MDIQKIFDLPPTFRRYNHEPYLTESHATVLYVDDRFAVFDQTLFYAESGGQIFDTGEINGYAVTNVQKRLGDLYHAHHERVSVPSVKINTRIVHEFATTVPFHVGDIVTMKIDWSRRYQIMKHHTLAHFLYDAITQGFTRHEQDLFLKGCVINEEKASFSLNNQVTPDMLAEIQHTTLAQLAKGGEIVMTPDQGTDEIFYWQHDEIIIPCGGTHIKQLSELTGNIVISKKSQGKQKCKLYIYESFQP